MTDLVDFLRARLDEDERVAQSCPQTHWVVSGPPAGHYAHSATSSYLGGWTGTNSQAILANPTFRAGDSLTHAARHDPARVLREVEAKRELINLCAAPMVEATCPGDTERRFVPGEGPPWAASALRLLALPYADHPDYNESWRP